MKPAAGVLLWIRKEIVTSPDDTVKVRNNEWSWDSDSRALISKLHSLELKMGLMVVG